MNYEEKLKEKFYKKFAGSVWSGLPVSKESFDDIWSFISQSFSDYKKELVEEILDIKVTDEPDEKEFSTLTKGKIFQAGQMNILFRLRKKISLLQKDKETEK